MFFFRKRSKRTIHARQRIVILGGGFAGVYAALRLEKTLARDPDIEIVLVSRENFQGEAQPSLRSLPRRG